MKKDSLVLFNKKKTNLKKKQERKTIYFYEQIDWILYAKKRFFLQKHTYTAFLIFSKKKHFILLRKQNQIVPFCNGKNITWQTILTKKKLNIYSFSYTNQKQKCY